MIVWGVLHATYQRLNVGLLAFASISLCSIPGEASFTTTFPLSMAIFGVMSISKLVGIVAAYKGWRTGVLGWTTKNEDGKENMFQFVTKELYSAQHTFT